MRTTVLTPDDLHPNFQPFLASIDLTACMEGPRAGISLATETFMAVSKRLEILAEDDEVTALEAESGIEFTDYVQLVEYLADRIESLCHQIQ